MRFILQLHSRKCVIYIEFEKLSFLNICSRPKQLSLNHVFNIYNNICPNYLHTNFVRNETYIVNTRSSNKMF